MKIITVAAGIVWRAGKILLCERGPGKALAGKWEFPGGKLEHGECLEDCLRRELFEELKIHVRVGEPFIKVSHHYEVVAVTLHSYFCDYLGGELVLTDHARYEWVLPDEILRFELAPADIPIACQLAQQFGPSRA